MKRFIAMIAVLCLICSLSLPAAALSIEHSEGKVALTLPDEFTAMTDSSSDLNKNSEFINTLGHSVTSFSLYMQDADMLIFAATADNQRQVQLKCNETEFSRQIEELSYLEDDQNSLDTAVEKLITVGENETQIALSRIRTDDGRIFIKNEKLINTAQSYSCMQYVTVTDGKYYALVYYNFGGEFTDAQRSEMESIFASLTLPGGSKTLIDDNTKTNVMIIIVSVLAVAAAVFVVILLISLIAELIRRKLNANADDVKIKRRKM